MIITNLQNNRLQSPTGATACANMDHWLLIQSYLQVQCMIASFAFQYQLCTCKTDGMFLCLLCTAHPVSAY